MSMAFLMVEEQFEMVLQRLNDVEVRKVVLFGTPGVGKSWMARKISDRASKEKFFCFVIWVSLSRNYDDMALCQSFAQQLCLLPLTEVEDDDFEQEEDIYELGNIQRMISEALAHKHFLIILDGVRDKNEEEEILLRMDQLFNISQQNNYKVLVTTTNNLGHDMTSVIEVKPLSMKSSWYLFREMVGKRVLDIPGIESLIHAYLERSQGLPAVIAVIAKALNYFSESNSGLQALEFSLDKVGYGENFDVAPLLQHGYKKLPSCILIDFDWHLSKFIGNRGSIHCCELITYWIMEGYFGQVESLEKAYMEGHRILLELIDFGLLRSVDNEYISMTQTPLNLDSSENYRRGSTASLGLADLLNGEGFGRMIQIDGAIRSYSEFRYEKKLQTLLVDGTFLARSLPYHLLQFNKDLQVVTVFNPRNDLFSFLSSKLDNLEVLVLRGCQFLEQLDLPKDFRSLTALEISGPSGSISEFPDDLFRQTPNLHTLNLSQLPITYLPVSMYDLDELRWLILRECSRLKTLNSLRNLKNLEVLDISGSTSLEAFQDRSFMNEELKVINVSNTDIIVFPLTGRLRKLTHLLLSGCRIIRLRSISLVSSLKVIDLSDTEDFNEFFDKSLESLSSLETFDLSGTSIGDVPHCNPCHLHLRRCLQLRSLDCLDIAMNLETLDISEADLETLPSLSHLRSLRKLSICCCRKLKELPDVTPLVKLETLDLSGCTSLRVIHGSLENLNRLQRLDLSETKLEHLPSISKLTNLRHLLLKQCTDLTALPQLDPLSKLEELNLSGIHCWVGIEVFFLNQMTHLNTLDLSDTFLKTFPPISNLKNLKKLYYRNNHFGSHSIPDLAVLTKLEILDLSGTDVIELPSLENFTNLTQLILKDCSRLQGFKHVQIIDVLEGKMKELPYGISKLTQLERLELPEFRTTQAKRKNIEEATSSCDWVISSVLTEDNIEPPIPLGGTQFLTLMTKSPHVWESSLRNFHFSIRLEEVTKNMGTSTGGHDLIFGDVNFEIRHANSYKDQSSLEIRGFSHFPKGIDEVLSRADCVFLVDLASEVVMSIIGSSTYKGIKTCSIEWCREVENIFQTQEVQEEPDMVNTLEVLSISNSINLKLICAPNLEYVAFKNLSHLYLDCCPKLPTLFSSSQLPRSLQVLHVKFCDAFERLFEPTSDELELRNLYTLHLWQLPRLKSIDCTLPSLLTLKVHECPNLEELEETIETAKDLETLWVSNVRDLKTIEWDIQQPESFLKLRNLTLESCPGLVEVSSTSKPPESLAALRITSCKKLKKVFAGGIPEDLSEQVTKIYLQDLPELENVGIRLQPSSDCIIINCPGLQG